MDRPELARRVRAQAPGLLILMVSAQPEAWEEARASGVDWFLPKDQLFEEMSAAAVGLLSRRQLTIGVRRGGSDGTRPRAEQEWDTEIDQQIAEQVICWHGEHSSLCRRVAAGARSKFIRPGRVDSPYWFAASGVGRCTSDSPLPRPAHSTICR